MTKIGGWLITKNLLQMHKNISILGVGKLGLCLALNLERKGFDIVGVDISQHYIDSLNEKTFTTTEPYVNEFLKQSNNIKFSTKLKDALDGLEYALKDMKFHKEQKTKLYKEVLKIQKLLKDNA